MEQDLDDSKMIFINN
jgi:hypothetical protein